SCHSPGAGGSGTFTITFNNGINQYLPGQTYPMSVTILQEGQKRWGFSMVARNSANQNVGSWIPTNTDSKTFSSNTHIGHKNAPVMTGAYTFHFSWTAPATPATGNVTFYASGVAANNNSSSSGDYVYLSAVSIAETVPQATIHLKLLLQGAVTPGTATMYTNLNSQNLLPTAQPFNTNPWNYPGTETVQTFTPDVTDWVLLEARSATNNHLILARKAALLLNNGTLKDANGNPGVTFDALPVGSYYIAVKHRNHLAALSASPINLPNGSICSTGSPCDFTLPANVTTGSQTLVNTGNNIWALPAGDINQDGAITYADYNAWRNGIIFIPAYTPADITLDGAVSLPDFNTFASNVGKVALPQLR
ncbi:MAG TPA: hypothetical protein PK715_10255, partial [Chitinophagales bacterium]|nr:hypothetical protein [Chitinophagales bacterium]